MKASLGVSALNNALALRSTSGTIVHSARQSVPFRQVRAGTSLDRPRRLHGTHRHVRRQRRDGVVLRPRPAERPRPRRWRSREELRLAVVIWIERTYHRRRRRHYRDHRSPGPWHHDHRLDRRLPNERPGVSPGDVRGSRRAATPPGRASGNGGALDARDRPAGQQHDASASEDVVVAIALEVHAGFVSELLDEVAHRCDAFLGILAWPHPL